MTTRFKHELLVSGLLLVAVSMPSIASAETIVSCSPTRVKASASSLEDSQTTSTTLVNIPETRINFTQGGNNPSCVLVRFSAVVFAAANNSSEIRASLDNTTAALPQEVQFSGADSALAGARSFEFIIPNVAPGNHSLVMKFRSLNGTAVHVLRHNTVVQFAP